GMTFFGKQLVLILISVCEILIVCMFVCQGMPFLPPFLIQQQPDILLPPQLVNFGAQVPGPFLTPQQNQLPPVMLLPSQQEQPTAPLNPNNPTLPQNPGFPYYLTYGFPLRNTLVKVPPTQKTGSQIPVRPTQGPLQPIQVGYDVSATNHDRVVLNIYLNTFC
uniref:Uncharacterized protein n=1 Tax=Electrophorus electricus TaxID=8005 RepID=A0A4W4GP41_ELEEL